MARTGVLLTAFGGPDSLDEVGAVLREPHGARAVAGGARAGAAPLPRRSAGASPLPEIARPIAEKLGERAARSGRRTCRSRSGCATRTPFIAERSGELVADGRRPRRHGEPLAVRVAAQLGRATATPSLEAAARCPASTIVEAPSLPRPPAVPRRARATRAARRSTDIARGRDAPCSSRRTVCPWTRSAATRTSRSCARRPASVARKVGTWVPRGSDVQQRWLPGVDAFGSGRRRACRGCSRTRAKGSAPGRVARPGRPRRRRARWRARASRRCVFAPIGFATDHLETLYDLDVEAARPGARPGHGVSSGRASRTTATQMIDALVEVVGPLL